MISGWHEVHVNCDNPDCESIGMEIVSSNNPNDRIRAKKIFKAKGWLLSQNGDLCPSCAKE